ncbi:carbohydrate sulfotransferase 11-like [Anneissia japonica]|uniref:carbohydrate sulfotransferase 11-like n=1 Tax=Anneissia japonica TaxID=1529436 RepID=UPI00142581E6|nr:carbohydrate sulfotransferase 11-like [Anneissia japonica]
MMAALMSRLRPRSRSNFEQNISCSMLNIQTRRIYSPQFLVGCFAVFVVYCMFIIISTSAIFEEEINLNAPNIQTANTFPWEQDDAEKIVYRRFTKTKQMVIPDNKNENKIQRKDKFMMEQPQVQNSRKDTQDTFMMEQSEVQKLRKDTLNEVCQKNPKLQSGDISHDTLRHIYVHESTKVLYCFVPKVACSNWKRVLMVISGHRKSIEEITSKEAHFKNGMKRLVGYSTTERDEMLRSYKKFMFARNPFVRILSAYKNKYQDTAMYKKETYFHIFAKRIMKKYRKNPSEHDLKTGEGITWTEFAQYLADPSQYRGFDDHWEEIYRLCSPCKVEYDFIGKLETISDDAKYILKSLNVDDKVSYPARANSHPTNSTQEFDNYYGKLDSSILQRLWEIYELDFKLFGYKKPNILN